MSSETSQHKVEVVPAFSGEVKDTSEITSSQSTIPAEEARHRRFLQKCTSGVLLITLLVTNGGAGYVLYQTFHTGTPEAQKLAFGFVGTILGVLWSNFAKLVDYVSKR